MFDRNDLARGWLTKGDHDFANAQQTLASGSPLDTACFHCQQAAEKYLKALLAWHGLSIPRTHDVRLLKEQCQAVAPGLGLAKVDVSILTPYAVDLRYDLDFAPSPEQTAQALALATQVRAAVVRLLPPIACP